jgi:acetylornithine/succinyldiaminopimelate/putrescine aminotransferase
MEGIAERWELVTGVRGEGLMQAIALQAPLNSGTLADALLGHGVVGRSLPYANSLAFSPPLVISDAEIDELLAGTDAALAELTARL